MTTNVKSQYSMNGFFYLPTWKQYIKKSEYHMETEYNKR